MTWTGGPKTLDISDKLPYRNSHPKVRGRFPLALSLDFTWYDFMAAAARASHMSIATPGAAGPEFQFMLHLVTPHVDDAVPTFRIEPSVLELKDFVGTFFTGTVAAGLSLLAMIEEGYVWFAHFEVLGSTAGATQSPDFVMLGPVLGIGVMESKGSAAAKERDFVGAVRKGYREQITPHLGFHVGGLRVTHGYCVGSWMRPGFDAEMRIAYTEPKAGAANLPGLPSEDPIDAFARAQLLRQNYAGAFTFAHSPRLGAFTRVGILPPEPPIFARFEWRGQRWLSALMAPDWTRFLAHNDDRFFVLAQHGLLRARHFNGAVFAVENDIGKAALAAFLSDADASPREALDIAPLDPDTLGSLRGGRDRESEGAVFPDGFALIDLPRDGRKVEFLKWDVARRTFERAGSDLL